MFCLIWKFIEKKEPQRDYRRKIVFFCYETFFSKIFASARVKIEWNSCMSDNLACLWEIRKDDILF